MLPLRRLPYGGVSVRPGPGYARHVAVARRAADGGAGGLGLQLRHGQLPAHIWMHDYCLISPAAPLEVDRRGWFRRAAGRETIRWVMRLPSGGYDLASWDLDQVDAVGHQKPSAVHWKRDDVIDRGVVVAVYRQEPTTDKPQEPVRDWRPDALAELSRAALFSDQFRKVEAEIDKAVAAVEQMEIHIKRRAAAGSISPFQAEQIPQSARLQVAALAAEHTRGTHDGSARRKLRQLSPMTATSPARNADQVSSSARRLARNVDRE